MSLDRIREKIEKNREGSATSTANAVLPVESRALGETVYFVADTEIARRMTEDEQKPAYSVDELSVLVGCTPKAEHLKKIHMAKKLFSGTVKAAEKK